MAFRLTSLMELRLKWCPAKRLKRAMPESGVPQNAWETRAMRTMSRSYNKFDRIDSNSLTVANDHLKVGLQIICT